MSILRRPGRSRRLPLGLLGMLLLIPAAERLIADHDYAILSVEDWDWRLAGEAAGREAARADLVCFGDSLIKGGLAPTVLEAKTGLRSYNLALGGGQAPAAYYLLRRVLKAGGRPKAVIVEFFPRLLELRPYHNIYQWPFLLDAGECLELGLATREGELLGSILTAKALGSYRSRHGIRAAIMDALAGAENVGVTQSFPRAREIRRNRGAFPFTGGHLPEYDLEGWMSVYFHAKEYDPVNLAYMRRFLDLAAEREIPVVWLVPPLMPELLAACERSGFDDSLTAFVGAIQSRYPHLLVIDARRSGFDSSLFHDPHHLDDRGAFALSTFLADRIVADPPRANGRGRWLDLPGFDPAPARLAVEDRRAPPH